MTQSSPLPTPLIADACLRLQLPLRMLPASIAPLLPSMSVHGCALPTRHYGSVDVFLEAMCTGDAQGRILAIDNQARDDEGPIGDLVVLEAVHQGIAGIVVDGRHRDTHELLEIGLPVFSRGSCAAGPRRLDDREPEALTSARLGDVEVTSDDTLFADVDGVLAVADEHLDDVLTAARRLHEVERRQAAAVTSGRPLHVQLRLDDYVRRRAKEPGWSFRQHLREVGGAIEE